jgi:O-antigen/teichoic acid export membrane protein
MSVARNTTILTIASICQRLLAFVYFTIIAREIGAENLGKYSFALSFAMIFTIFVDLGLTSAMVREVAKTKEKLKEFTNAVFGAKVLLSVFTYGLIFAVINIMNYPEMTRNFVYLAAISLILDSFHLTFYGVFRGNRNLKYESIGLVLGQLIVLGFGMAVVYLNLSLYLLFGALISGSIFNIIYSAILVKLKENFFPRPVFDKESFKYLFKISISFALAGIFVKIYSYLDTVLLSYLKGDLAAGWYSIPIKLTLAFQFIPMALVASLYPTMSYYYSSSKERLEGVFLKGMRYLMFIAVPLAFGLYVISDKIILTLYGTEYIPSILPLKILAFGLIFAFLSFPVGSLLNACDRQKTQTKILGATMIINIILNSILIYYYGVIGASITAFISYLFLVVAGMVQARKIVKYNILYLSKISIQSIFASVLMASTVYLLKPYAGFVTLAIVGILIYPVYLCLMGGVEKEDIGYLRKIFLNR